MEHFFADTVVCSNLNSITFLSLQAVIEDVSLKQTIFSDLEKFCPPHCILASNTSTIDLNLVGKKTSSQDRIGGAHFFRLRNSDDSNEFRLIMYLLSLNWFSIIFFPLGCMFMCSMVNFMSRDPTFIASSIYNCRLL